MTYLDLIRDADRKLDKGHITLGEYEQMIAPLKREMQPKRKHGKWIPTTYRYVPLKDGSLNTKMIWIDATEPDGIEGMKCSECGTVFDFTEARNWCSECGADMRGGDSNE